MIRDRQAELVLPVSAVNKARPVHEVPKARLVEKDRLESKDPLERLACVDLVEHPVVRVKQETAVRTVPLEQTVLMVNRVHVVPKARLDVVVEKDVLESMARLV